MPNRASMPNKVQQLKKSPRVAVHEWTLIHSAKKTSWFNTEIETGNKIGRFANQRGVLQVLGVMKEMSTKKQARNDKR